MSKPEKKALLPVKRFPEFRETREWQLLHGDKVFDQVSNKDHNSDLPILAITQEYGAIPREEINYNVSVTDKSIESYKVVEAGDFIISLRSFQGGIEYSNYRGLCSPAYVILRKKIDVSNHFYKQFFKTNIFIQSMNKNIEGIRDGKMVSYKQFSELLLPYPLPDEQRKIADCLTSVDELITTQTQKLNALKTHKKGLMQQLFPAEGETVPKRRFPGFRDKGEWGEIELGQLGELVSGLTYSPGDIRDEGLLVLRSSNVQNGMIALEDNVFVRSDIKGANPSKPNDILICVRNGSKSLIGKNALIPDGMSPCTHGAFMTVFRSKSAKFIFQLFQTNAYEKQVSADLGATINSINGNQFRKYKFLVPERDEQQKIADCLTSIDELISNQAKKVEALKAHKKGLMQQLFPTMDEVSA